MFPDSHTLNGFHQQHHKIRKFWGWRENSADKVAIWHASDIGLIPDTLCGPLGIDRGIQCTAMGMDVCGPEPKKF